MPLRAFIHSYPRIMRDNFFDKTRCEMWRRSLLIICLAATTALPAWAFERPFPPSAKRGTMSPAPHPEIVIDGKSRRLSPGARIWNQRNLIEMPAALRGTDLVVNYTEDMQGQIDRVWILTVDEASRPVGKPAAKPANTQPK